MAGLIWTLLSIGLALMQQYLVGVVPLFLLAILLHYGAKALGFELHFWDLFFALPRWVWLILACASSIAGWKIDKKRTHELRALFRNEDNRAMQEIADDAADFNDTNAATQPELSESEYLERVATTSAEYFDELDAATLHQPGEAVMAMLMGPPLKAAKAWALGLGIAAVLIAGFLAVIGARSEIVTFGILALALAALTISANSVVTLQRLAAGVAENLSVALAPAVLRDRELRNYLVRRVRNDAFALLLTALPLLIICLTLLVLAGPRPLLHWTNASAALIGFAAFAAIYPGVVALIYLSYRPSEAVLWLLAMLTSATLVIAVLMLLGRWPVTTIWLTFVFCVLVACVNNLRYQPIRLVDFLRAEQLRPSRFF